MMYVGCPVALRTIARLLYEREIDITHETMRFWWKRFAAISAAKIRRRRVAVMRHVRHRSCYLEEFFVNRPRVKSSLCRAVRHEGEVFDTQLTKKRSAEFSNLITADEFS